MKIVVDNKIPYIRETLAKITDNVVYMSGNEINSETVKDADALITRTRTRCDRQLLEGSRVKFIGTATIGFDHIDTEFCNKAGIVWKNCPGCNAGAVEQYVHAVLTLLKEEKGLKLENVCMGIIGVGHVGSRIMSLAKKLGMKIMLNDPPRKDNGESEFVDLDTIAAECDVITFHTPLIKEGKYKTFHLADKDFFATLRKKPVIINTSRGEVVDTSAILDAINEKRVSEAIIDVWENEPHINLDLLHKVYVGTPHIAGYSSDGKLNATIMTLKSLCEFFHLDVDINLSLDEDLREENIIDNKDDILSCYNPKNDYSVLLSHPEDFEKIRGNYKLRKE